MTPRNLVIALTSLVPLICAAAPASPPPAGARAIAAAYSAADRAFERGELPLARDLTRQLTEHYPDDPATWVRLAQVEQRLGAFNEALAAYDNALDVEAAYSIDGGRTLAKIHYQRATLLLTEAQRALTASDAAPLGGTLDATRAELRRVLDQSNGLLRADRAPRAAPRDTRPVRGYVVDTPRAASPSKPAPSTPAPPKEDRP